MEPFVDNTPILLQADPGIGTPTYLLIGAALALGFVIGWLINGSQYRLRLEAANRLRKEAQNEAAELRIERDQFSDQAAKLQREKQESSALHPAGLNERSPTAEAVLHAAYAERDRLKPILLSTEKALAENRAEKDKIFQELQQLGGIVSALKTEISQLRSETAEAQQKLTVSEQSRGAYTYPHIDFDPNTSPHPTDEKGSKDSPDQST